MSISELIEFAEVQAEKEREASSLVEPESLERYASWAATLRERGVPESLKEETP